MHPLRLNLPRFDRLRHVLVVGKTGMGKSTLLSRMCREDVASGRGLLLIDPHGDLVAQVLTCVPRRRKNDLVPFHAQESSSCPGLNPLRRVEPKDRALVVSGLLATMRKLWPDFWGPRLEHVLRHTLLALMEVRGATLDDAQRMLVEEPHRAWVLRQVKDPHVLRFWVREFPGYGTKLAAEALSPVLNKLGALLASPVIREIATKRRPVLDAGKAMSRGWIVLASLPKGQIGEDAALLLGGLLLGAFQQATMARAAIAREERRPFAIIVDEVSSFVTRPFVEMVAEARKYGVGLVLAAQSLAAMDEQFRAALLGNVDTLVGFRVGAEDAEILQKEFVDRFGPATLMRLDVGEMVVRTGSALPTLIARDENGTV